MSHSLSEAEKEMPDILQYTNYRVFLKDYYQFKKETTRSFSLRFFAEKAGLSSHAHLKLVMDGKRNITKSTITKFIIGIGLEERRAEYFEHLVYFNQAESDKEKQLFYEKLLRISPESRLHLLDKTQFRIFREWYHTVLREMVTLNDAAGAAEWFSRRIRGSVSPKDVEESLKMMVELGLLIKTPSGYKQSDAWLTTDDEVSNLLVKDWHREMIGQAEQAMDDLGPEDRDVSAVSFGIRKKDFENLKKHIQLMRKELLYFAAPAGEAEEVVQVNIQIFPLTRNGD